MASLYQKFFQSDYTFMEFEELSLRCYSPEEIQRLSVIQVTQTKTFDEVNFPIKGGLYDPSMGPIESFDSCETCTLPSMYCPGHMGHIQLEVPTFNPLLFNFTYNLLKGTCVNCHKFMCKTGGIATRVLLAQLKCLDLGMIDAAMDIQRSFNEKKSKGENDKEMLSLTDELAAMSELETALNTLNEKIDEKSKEKTTFRPTKNSHALRSSLIREFTRSHLFIRKAKCPICSFRCGTLRNESSRFIIIDFTGRGEEPKDGKAKKKQRNLTLKKILDPGIFPEEAEDDDEKDDKKNIQALDSDLPDPTKISEFCLNEQVSRVKTGLCKKLAWRAAEVREHLRLVWKKDSFLLRKVFPFFEGVKMANPVDILFSDIIPVPATKFRPIRFFKGDRFEHPQTVNLRRILEANEILIAINKLMRERENFGDELYSQLNETIMARVVGKTMNEKMHNAYLELQLKVNAVYDQDLTMRNDPNTVPGLKQILEKKEGLFRMHMMGKRVNYACRSVITPDPYLDIDEIGIPEVFAKRLTFGEPVNFLNTQKMRKLVQTGPEVHPGANFTSDGSRKKVIRKEDFRERLATSKLLGISSVDNAPVVVHRHLDRGDLLLMNRQPSLHKPSIMGHRARVLKGQRTLRMNYAPCKAYNADFDGDEMNGHFVQDRIAQTEAAELANVGSNYLVPKDGTPILGLIQDHIVSGVLMTIRGRFFNKEDFMHLVLAAFAETSQRIEIPPPTIFKPKRLWSGKQIITAIICNCVPKGSQLINLKSKSKTPLNCWQVKGHGPPKFEMSESEVIFRQGELLCGVLDKSHYGASQYGLIHCCYELYGHRVAAKILSCFSRVFTTYLQFHGFSLGVADILVTDDANEQRRSAVKQLRKIGDSVVIQAFGLDENATKLKIKHNMAMAYNNPRNDDGDVKTLDYTMKKEVTKYNDMINKACVPSGLIRSFPDNALQMMIQSGAKGSLVNSIQISCALGQIELEGKRPPLTAVGRTLPSFKAFDTSPRAGGFVDQRFLTGINPQELFFHTMAGREGLIDTAVKTSRSGYLQRCIIKHLEGITVHYDQTVRDHDNTVIQFRYGEDGMDVGRSIFLNSKHFDFLEDNLKAVRASATVENVMESDWKVRDAEKQFSKIRKWKKKYGHLKKNYVSGFTLFSSEHPEVKREGLEGIHPLVELWNNLSEEEKDEYNSRVDKKCPEIVNEIFNSATTLGALPEKMLEEVENHSKKSETPAEFRRTIFWKGVRAMVEPGENVGLLASQSIGEPSTQMTLNTFHFAGRGEMNVTLGIPRLREILMTEGRNATPQTEILIRKDAPQEIVEKIQQELNRVYLKQVIRKFMLDEKVNISKGATWRHYHLTIELLRQKSRDQRAQHLSREFIMRQIETRFLGRLARAVHKQMNDVADFENLSHKKLRSTNMQILQDDQQAPVSREDAESSDEEIQGGEADAEEARLTQRHHDDAAEYQGEEEEIGDVQTEKKIEDEIEFEEILDDSEVDDEEEKADDSNVVDEEETPVVLTKDKKTGPPEATRIAKALHSSSLIANYKFDPKSNRWCVVTFQLPVKRTKLDFSAIVEREIDEFIVSQTPDIEKCLVDEEKRNGEDVKILKTQGVNLQAFFKHTDFLDVNTIYTNDLQTILNFYGVEACTKAIVKEMNNVFSAYGIEVNPRHLTLTADYMTATGKISPFNRAAMASSPSPLQKMTFETTSSFLREAVLQGENDYLKSPSARLVTGQMMRGGTGAFDLLVNKSYLKRNSKGVPKTSSHILFD